MKWPGHASVYQNTDPGFGFRPVLIHNGIGHEYLVFQVRVSKRSFAHTNIEDCSQHVFISLTSFTGWSCLGCREESTNLLPAR